MRQIPAGERLTDEMLGALTVYAHAIAPAHEATGPRQRALDDSLIGEALRVDAYAYVVPSRSCWRAIVRLTGNVQNPFQVFVWQAFEPAIEFDPD